MCSSDLTGAVASQANSSFATFTAPNVASTTSQVVTVSVTDGVGNIGSGTRTISVAPATGLTASLTAPAIAPINVSVSLSAQAISGGTACGGCSYTWTGQYVTPTAQGSSTATFTGPAAGLYSVSVMVSDPNQNTSSTGALIGVLPACNQVPAREYVRVGARVVAVENTACAAGQ